MERQDSRGDARYHSAAAARLSASCGAVGGLWAPRGSGVEAAASLAWEEFEREQAKARQREHGGTAPGRTLPQKPAGVSDTREALAKRAGVSRYKIEQAQKVKRHDEENGTELLGQVEVGDVPLRQAVRLAKVRPDRRR